MLVCVIQSLDIKLDRILQKFIISMFCYINTYLSITFLSRTCNKSFLQVGHLTTFFFYHKQFLLYILELFLSDFFRNSLIYFCTYCSIFTNAAMYCETYQNNTHTFYKGVHLSLQKGINLAVFRNVQLTLLSLKQLTISFAKFLMQ